MASEVGGGQCLHPFPCSMSPTSILSSPLSSWNLDGIRDHLGPLQERPGELISIFSLLLVKYLLKLCWPRSLPLVQKTCLPVTTPTLGWGNQMRLEKINKQQVHIMQSSDFGEWREVGSASGAEHRKNTEPKDIKTRTRKNGQRLGHRQYSYWLMFSWPCSLGDKKTLSLQRWINWKLSGAESKEEVMPIPSLLRARALGGAGPPWKVLEAARAGHSPLMRPYFWARGGRELSRCPGPTKQHPWGERGIGSMAGLDVGQSWRWERRAGW